MMDFPKKPKKDMLLELFQGQVVGGTLSQLANYSDLFQRMNEAVFLLDRNSFRVLECNEAARRLLAKPEEEILGIELPELFRAPDGWTRALRDGFGATEFVFHNDHGDELFFEVSATSLKILDYIEVVQFMARDVTAVKKAESDLREANEALTRLSTTDEMTGLWNYRYLKEVHLTVHAQSSAGSGSYGIIFIDVDHFKKFNDRNGHPAGDQVLRGVAEVLKSVARVQDLPARYGGEEFVMLCRHSTAEECLSQGEAVRKAIEARVFPFGEHQPLGRVTVSVGVAAFPVSGQAPEDILKAADEALYRSKEGGRNRVSEARASVTPARKAS